MSESNDLTNLVITEDKLSLNGDDVSVSIWHYVKVEDNKAEAEVIKLGAKISKEFLDSLAAEKERTNSDYITYKNLDDAVKDYLSEKHGATNPVLIVIQHPGHEPYLLVEENRLVLPSASSPTSSARISSADTSSADTSSAPCPPGKVRVSDGQGGSECLPKD